MSNVMPLQVIFCAWSRTMQSNQRFWARTPVYMSPELINSRNGAKGYDGRHVDVWASGVLLIVMLLGAFPFDHIEHPDPNTSEAHLEVWCVSSLSFDRV